MQLCADWIMVPTDVPGSKCWLKVRTSGFFHPIYTIFQAGEITHLLSVDPNFLGHASTGTMVIPQNSLPVATKKPGSLGRFFLPQPDPDIMRARRNGNPSLYQAALHGSWDMMVYGLWKSFFPSSIQLNIKLTPLNSR